MAFAPEHRSLNTNLHQRYAPLSEHFKHAVEVRGKITALAVGFRPQLRFVPKRSPSPGLSAWILLVMLVMVAVPAGITLHTVRAPAIVQMTSTNPTPYGYSWSLLLFVVPIVVIGWWFLPSEGIRISQRAFWRTIWVLVPCGFALDFFFACRFFL